MIWRRSSYQAYGISIRRGRSREGQLGFEQADLKCARGSTLLADFAGFGGFGGVLGRLPLVLVLTTVVLHARHHFHVHRLHWAGLDGRVNSRHTVEGKR